MRHPVRNSKGIRWLAVASLTIPLAVFSTSSADAESGPYLIDGDIPDGAFTELPDLSGNIKELGPLNSNTTKIGVIHKDAVPTLGETNPNSQVDLRRAWIDTARSDGKDWLYFAWERDKNTGSGFIAYEFMRNEEPTACDYGNSTSTLIANCNPWRNRQGGDPDADPPVKGDFMILWDQQGGSTDLWLRTWSGTYPNLTLSAPALINPNLGEARYSDDGFSGEAAINLTDLLYGGVLTCLTFANTIPSTVTGNSDTADYKDTILTNSEPISNCESTTETTPKVVTDTETGASENVPALGASIGTGVLAVADSAVVDVQGASPAADGSVHFWLCEEADLDEDGRCSEGGTDIGSTDVSGAAYPVTVQSPTAYVTSAGRYCWRAEFSGDADNGIPGSSDSRESECFDVNPVDPELTTEAGDGVVLGQAVTDTATLGGTATQPANPVINTTGAAGDPATGTITFTLMGPDNCTTEAYVSDPVDVEGDGDYTAQFTPTAPGDYSWVAVYSGDSPNTNDVTHNADCTVGAEDVTVETVPSSMETDQSWVPNDSATISASAGGPLDGTATFKLYASDDCGDLGGDSPIYTQSVSVAGPASGTTVSTTNTTPQTESGEFSWQVRYVSKNPAQENIGASCHETSSLTISNGGTVSSTP